MSPWSIINQQPNHESWYNIINVFLIRPIWNKTDDEEYNEETLRKNTATTIYNIQSNPYRIYFGLIKNLTETTTKLLLAAARCFFEIIKKIKVIW